MEEEFEKMFLDLLDYTKDGKKVVFKNEDDDKVNHPTNRYEIRNSKDEWLFDIDYHKETPHFLYSLCRILPIFEDKFNLKYNQINSLMKGIMKKHNIYKETTPCLLYYKKE